MKLVGADLRAARYSFIRTFTFHVVNFHGLSDEDRRTAVGDFSSCHRRQGGYLTFCK